MKRLSKTILFYLTIVVLSISELYSQDKEQELSSERYIVISFNRIRMNETRVFYWIIFPNSISKNIYPTFLPFDDKYGLTQKSKTDSSFLKKIGYPFPNDIPLFSGSYLDDVNGAIQEPGMSLSQTTNNFFEIIDKNKKEIQRVYKRWVDHQIGAGIEDLARHDEEIIIYATPVIGRFMLGWKYVFEGKNLKYSGYAYKPTDLIRYDNDYWSSEECNSIKYADFSYLKFWEYSIQNTHSADNLGFSIFQSIKN